VPGDYLGGDGGMDSDYDDVIAPSEFFGTDEKGDAPFGDIRGFGPADRAPIYQVWLPCVPAARLLARHVMYLP